MKTLPGVACLLAMGLATITAAAPPAGATDDSETTLSVLTLNVWHGLRSGESKRRFPGEEEERRERRFAWQLEEIRRLDPDVLLLQEVNPNQRQARRYAAELGYDEIHKVTSCGVHLGVLLKIPANVNEGLAILARPELGLRRMGSKRLSGNACCAASFGFQTRESRYGLFGAITWGGRELLVATTHLFSPGWVPAEFEGELERLTEDGRLEPGQRDEILSILEDKRQRNLDEARRLLAEIDRRRGRLATAAEPVPVVLGGDFNAEPGSAGVTAVEQAGLRSLAAGDGFRTWDPVTNRSNYAIGTKRADPLPTFGVEAISEMLGRRDETPRQIDLLFATEALEAVSVRMVMDRPREGIYPSDHFGILAELRLAGGGAGGEKTSETGAAVQ